MTHKYYLWAQIVDINTYNRGGQLAVRGPYPALVCTILIWPALPLNNLKFEIRNYFILIKLLSALAIFNAKCPLSTAYFVISSMTVVLFFDFSAARFYNGL